MNERSGVEHVRSAAGSDGLVIIDSGFRVREAVVSSVVIWSVSGSCGETWGTGVCPGVKTGFNEKFGREKTGKLGEDLDLLLVVSVVGRVSGRLAFVPSYIKSNGKDKVSQTYKSKRKFNTVVWICDNSFLFPISKNQVPNALNVHFELSVGEIKSNII